MKIALALIVKGSDEEAELLDRCLTNITQSPVIDGIFITSTYKDEPNVKIDEVCEKHGAKVSYFKWTGDFAEARNFNFSHVPKEYDYIMWCDADDIWQNANKIRAIIEENPTVDAFAFWYYYEFDSYNNPTVVHKKTQIIRNDGCAKWVGKLHEDLNETRALIMKFIEGVQRIHLTNEERVKVAMARNVDISKSEAETNPDDPKVYFNLANSYLGTNQLKLAKETYLKFIASTGSDDEKYLAYQRMSAVEHALDNREKAVEYLLLAIGMFPELPDAYNNIGYLYFGYNQMDKAEKYLLIGLTMKPQYHKMIVYNPRDYDYNPMMALAKVYFNKARPDYALPLLKGCLQIYPKDEHIKELIKNMEIELANLERIIQLVKQMESYPLERIRKEIDALPLELQSHPAICRVRNQHFIKTESTGKDIAYYCGETQFDWNPDLFKTKGFGGSEEAVVNLSKQWAKLGYNVTVFNSCGLEVMKRDGVTYKPFWHFNPRDKYDHLVLWRTPRLIDHEINATNIYIDLHDVISAGEFNEKRLAKINKIFVKTKSHRELFPNIPDDKIAIVPNGMDFELFDQDVRRDPYLLVNTSSPDRSLDVLPELFAEVKKRVPEAKCAWAYGWENFDNAFKNDKDKMEWKAETIRKMNEAGIEDRGRLSQKDCAKLYLEGKIFAYPSEFYEIDCISVKKAQAAGCFPVTTDFAALKESNKYGVAVHSHKTKDTWNRPYQFHFGIEDRATKDEWVNEVVRHLKQGVGNSTTMKTGMKSFDWPIIAKKWTNIFQ
jgi:glycosyltransferase involved in cell wall biosynthesis